MKSKTERRRFTLQRKRETDRIYKKVVKLIRYIVTKIKNKRKFFRTNTKRP